MFARSWLVGIALQLAVWAGSPGTAFATGSEPMARGKHAYQLADFKDAIREFEVAATAELSPACHH